MKINNKKIIFDFDSTFAKVEGLEELADLALADRNDKVELLEKISEITNRGMNGELDFTQSLQERLKVIPAKREHVDKLAELLKSQISNSFRNNKDFIKENSGDIYIFSGGFKDFMLPVLYDYGIDKSHVYANTFVYNDNDEIIGFDDKNYLSQQGGEPRQLDELNLEGKICVVGDGWTDYEMKKQGTADIFIAFTENVKRDKVISVADYVAEGLDGVIEFVKSA